MDVGDITMKGKEMGKVTGTSGVSFATLPHAVAVRPGSFPKLQIIPVNLNTRISSTHDPIQASLFTNQLPLLIRSRLLSDFVNPHPSIYILVLLPHIILNRYRRTLLVLELLTARLHALNDEIRVPVITERNRVPLHA